MISCKKIFAIIIVAIGPMLAIMEALPEPIRLIPSEIMNDGITVVKTAIVI